MGPALTGTVVGTLTSSLGGSLASVHVVVRPSGGSPLAAVVTGNTGAFVATSVPVTTNNGTVTLSALPANCPVPSPTSYTGLTGGDTLTVDMTVVCSSLVSTVRGTVTSTLGGGLAGVGVIVTPHTGGALGAVLTGPGGAYTVSNVPADSTGTVTLTNLPASCTMPSAASYSGLAYGDTVTVGIMVTCSPAAGAVTGTVTSSVGGTALVGVQVVVTPTGGQALPAATTTAGGVYTVTGVPLGTGAGTVTVSGVPGYCTAPSASSYTGLTAGVTVTTNIAVPCVVATGTVSGTVTSSQGGGLAGVQVVVTPSGGTALPAVVTASGGAYSVVHVPVGSGAVALTSGLPLQCSAPSAVAYTGLAYNGTATTNVVAPCQQLGSLTVTIASSLGSATVTGPGGYTQTVKQTTTLTGLVPGAYTASATSYQVPGAIVGTVYDGTLTGSPAQVTGGATVGLSVSYGVRGGTGDLWVLSQDGPNFDWAAYTNAQLLAGGTPTPVASGLVFEELGGAVDRNGTIWLAGLSMIGGFSPASIAASGFAGSYHGVTVPYGYFYPAFDAGGNLWVQGYGGVGEFTAAQLAAGGAQNFARQLGTSYDQISGLAFGPDGTLWVASSDETPGNTCHLWGFTAAQLAGAGGAPAYTVNLTNAVYIDGMAFDANWNLWVAQGLNGNQVNMYTQSQLIAGGAPSATDSIFTNPPTYPSVVVFDASDNMWVGSANDSTLSAYTPLQLTTSGTPVPAISVKLHIPPIKLVFDPPASNVLLNGSRVAPPRGVSRPR